MAEMYPDPMNNDNPHVTAYRKAFPLARPNIFQMEMIELEVTDGDAWNETLRFWLGNDYRAQSVFKMLEYYKEVIQKRPANRPAVGRWDGTVGEIKQEACDICGETYCLSAHTEERRAIQTAQNAEATM
jgi:hypothetical protein